MTLAFGHVIYGDKQNNQILYNRSFGSTAFSGEGALSLGGFIGTADIEVSPTDTDRLFRGALEQNSLDIKTSIFDSSTNNWTETTTVTLNAGYALRKHFDIEFEESTGDAIIVYTDNTAGNLRYRTMLSSASDWGTEQTLTGAGFTGTPRWIIAKRDPDTDDVMVVWEDSNFDIFTALWNGSAFGSVTVHETDDANAADDDKDSPPFDIAWEGGVSNSEAVIVWVDSVMTVNYNTWTGGAWGTAGTISMSLDADGKGAEVTLSTRWSDEHQRIGLTAVGGDEKTLWANVWSGSAWGTTVQLSTDDSIDAGNGRFTESVWQKTTGDLFVPWISNNDTGIRLRIYDVSSESWGSDLGPLFGTAAFKGYLRADADINSQAIVIIAGARDGDTGTFGLICADSCSTGQASEWTTIEIDTDGVNERSGIPGDIVFY